MKIKKHVTLTTHFQKSRTASTPLTQDEVKQLTELFITLIDIRNESIKQKGSNYDQNK